MYSIDISAGKKGTYTKVKTVLDDNTVDWSYEKPVFSFACDDTTLDEVTADLEELDLGVSVQGVTSTADPVVEAVQEAIKEATPEGERYVAYCQKGRLIFKRGGPVDASDEELLARHADDGVTHIDIFGVAPLRTIQ
jgi:hypothetical protein